VFWRPGEAAASPFLHPGRGRWVTNPSYGLLEVLMGIDIILTLIIAIYGAVVATVLGIREFQRDKRKISIILEYITFYEYAQITMTNTGHRPITITAIKIAINQDGNWDQVPVSNLFELETSSDETLFPFTIDDGEYKTLRLHSLISEALSISPSNVKLSVYDIEGNVYSKFLARMFNPKWGFFEKLKKMKYSRKLRSAHRPHPCHRYPQKES